MNVNDFADALRQVSPEMGELWDKADRADELYDDDRQRQDDEREEMLEAALTECLKAGVSVESLRTLARETGATHWALKNSLRKE